MIRDGREIISQEGRDLRDRSRITHERVDYLMMDDTSCRVLSAELQRIEKRRKGDHHELSLLRNVALTLSKWKLIIFCFLLLLFLGWFPMIIIMMSEFLDFIRISWFTSLFFASSGLILENINNILVIIVTIMTEWTSFTASPVQNYNIPLLQHDVVYIWRWCDGWTDQHKSYEINRRVHRCTRPSWFLRCRNQIRCNGERGSDTTFLSLFTSLSHPHVIYSDYHLHLWLYPRHSFSPNSFVSTTVVLHDNLSWERYCMTMTYHNLLLSLYTFTIYPLLHLHDHLRSS